MTGGVVKLLAYHYFHIESTERSLQDYSRNEEPWWKHEDLQILIVNLSLKFWTSADVGIVLIWF